MAGIGELSVFVSANTKKAQANLMKFRSSVDKTSKTAKKAASVLSSLTGIGVAGSFAGAAYQVNQTMQEMDKLAKTADKLGIAPERLAGLRHAAEQTGVGVNQLDMGLQRMLRRISEASIGKGEAVGALKELNLNAEELNQLAPDVVLGRVAQQLNKVDGQSNKLRLAMKLFDSEGVALVNTLKLGESGLADMIAEAKDLSIAPTRAELARIESANDAMDRAAKSISGSFVSASVELAPMLEKAADSFAAKMKQVIEFWSKFMKGAEFEGNASAIARSGVSQERKDAAMQANRAVQQFREMGQHAMADKAQAALDFQLGSWMNELGGMTFSDGRKEIETLASQASKSYDIWKASQQSASEAAANTAKKQEEAAKAATEHATAWTESKQSVIASTQEYMRSMGGMLSGLPVLGNQASSVLAATMRRDTKKEKEQFATASIQSAMGGTREAYQLRAEMMNRANDVGLQIQREQLATQESNAAETARAADATEQAAAFLGEIAGRATASMMGV